MNRKDHVGYCYCYCLSWGIVDHCNYFFSVLFLPDRRNLRHQPKLHQNLLILQYQHIFLILLRLIFFLSIFFHTHQKLFCRHCIANIVSTENAVVACIRLASHQDPAIINQDNDGGRDLATDFSFLSRFLGFLRRTECQGAGEKRRGWFG